MEQFVCPTRICAGQDALDALGNMGIRRLLLVTDPYFLKNGQAEQVAQKSGAGQVEIFSDITPDPSVELVARGTRLVQSFGPDTVVALGGGSALDCAKAMGYFGNCPVVAIPTTSGSGSEVTDFAILTHGEVKHPLVDEKLRPVAAILDDRFLQALPRSLIADTGFDVLSHALESYVATNSSAVTDALGAHAFRVTLGGLEASFRGDLSARMPIHLAATMAGMAFSQAGLGLCHALAHALGGAFHLPHGRLNAILLPEVIRLNGELAGSKYAELARAAGLEGTADRVAVRNLCTALTRLRRRLEIPETLAQAGIRPGSVREKTGLLVAAALADPCCATNPVPVTENGIRKILEAVTGYGE